MNFFTSWYGVLTLFLSVIAIWSALPLYFYFQHGQAPTSIGEYGDVFGSVGALFSGLAFAGLIVTLAMQHMALVKQGQELSLSSQALKQQVEEMQAQRTEMKENTETLARQQSVVSKQAFESTFFNMLKLWNERASHLSLDKDGKNMGIYQAALGRLGYTSGLMGKKYSDDPVTVSSSFPVEFQTYFIMLFNLISFVDQSQYSMQEKKIYTRLVRAHLTDGDMVVILYNCVGPKGRGLGKLAYKYQLFRYISPEMKAKHKNAWEVFKQEFAP